MILKNSSVCPLHTRRKYTGHTNNKIYSEVRKSNPQELAFLVLDHLLLSSQHNRIVVNPKWKNGKLRQRDKN